MKIAFFEVEKNEEDYLKNQFKNTEVYFFTHKLSPENVNLAKECDIVSVFIDSQIDKNILYELPKLRMIATRSTGFDHIDLQECTKNNIIVCNVPHYGDNSVAEYAFALILNLSRRMQNSIQRVKSGDFSFEGLIGFDLKGKTIGIVGLGNIGRHVARIAQGFQMNILGFDVTQDKKFAKKVGLKYVGFEDLLKESDIITLHVPYNKNTHHLINSSNINLIKRGAYLINTSRGGVIETNALVKALSDGTVAGAGLDVLEEENFLRDEEEHMLSKEISQKINLKTVLEDHILIEKDNVIITPHNAFNSKEALERILETTILNINQFTKNKPVNIVK